MTLYCPDVNVWLALSVQEHAQHETAMRWLRRVRIEERLLFSRYTQLGLLRLLMNPALLDPPLAMLEAWQVFDRWLEDPRTVFTAEPRSMDTAFRQASAPFADQAAARWLGNCYVLAFARETDSILVTFDQALFRLANRMAYSALIPA